jgi:hypothetical protein
MKAVDELTKYFEENPAEPGYIASIDVNGNAKVS